MTSEREADTRNHSLNINELSNATQNSVDPSEEELPTPNEILPNTNETIWSLKEKSSETTEREFLNVVDIPTQSKFHYQHNDSNPLKHTPTSSKPTQSPSRIDSSTHATHSTSSTTATSVKYSTPFYIKYQEEIADKKIVFADPSKLNTYLTNLTKYPEIKEYLNKERYILIHMNIFVVIEN
jgi:hypothetical protein